MNREKELTKNTIILGLGKFLPKFFTIITLPIITACLTKSEYGMYDYITTLVMLLLPIATLQVQSAAFRFLIDCRGDKNKSTEIITNIFAITIPISLIVIILLILFWQSINLSTRILIGIYFIVDILYITISQITRGLSYNKYYSVSSVLISFFNAMLIIITLKLNGMGLNGIMISFIIANLVSIIYLVYKIKIFSYINYSFISFKTCKDIISYSWPMIPNNLSNWVLKLSDRLVITYFLGIEANAIYAVANKVPNILSMGQSILVMAWQENASLAVKDKDASEYYSKMFRTIFDLMFGFTAILIAMTPILFYFLIKGDYNDAYIHMPILILAMFFYCMSAFQGGIYVAHKKTKNVGITTTMTAICNLLIDLLLVNRIGIAAGSISTLVSYFLLYIYRLLDIQKFQKINYNVRKQIVCILIVIIMLIICSINNIYLNVLNFILSIVIIMIVDFSYIKDFYYKLTNRREMK
jgi:O-antigen/teichoic acid export membrane protein